jgi:TonB-linked SusC/RagA family outer membrane protein
MKEPYRNYVTAGLGIKFLLLACLTLISVRAEAISDPDGPDIIHFQQRLVRGVVTDETGSPFPFVNVFVESNVTIGTITNEKGEYRLSVPPNSNLSFAFVGYRTLTFPVGETEVLNVTMELEMKALDEVVVVGFGEQRRATVSAAVTAIKASEITQSPVANVTNALAGRLPGLTTIQSGGQPGRDAATLYVRGRGTWNNAEPLYVIDGVERTAELFTIMDPGEIESFTVLKDAAATSVYGTKGANGVVIITTKRGQEGTTAVSVNLSTTFQQFTRYPNYLDSYQSLLLYNEALMNDGNDPVFTEYDLEMYRTGADPYRYPNTDWYELMMKKVAPQYNGSFNIRGGSRTVRYFFSGSYMRQEGQLKTSQGQIYNPEFAFNRYRFSSNVDALITKAFTLSLELGGTYGDLSEPYQQLEIFRNMNRLAPWYMPATNPDGSFAGNAEFPQFNPYYLLQTRGSYDRINTRLTSAIKLDLKLDKYVKGLSVNVRGAFDSGFELRRQWTETQNTYQLVSREGRADRYVEYLERVFFGSSIASDEEVDRKLDLLGNIIYNRRLDDHTIRLQFAANIAERRILDRLPYNSILFVGRANYGYKGKYNVEANASYRGSENFAPGRRFGLFPSLSASWNIHEEDFFEPVTFVDILKLRLSYGKTGNDYAGTRFIYKEGKWTTGTTGYSYFGHTTGASLGYSLEPSIANPLATWETAQQINMGVDMELFRNRLGISFDRYFERREGILQTPRSISGVLGIGVPDMNIGETSRNGYELEINFRGQLTGDITYYIRPNIAYAINKVVFRDEPADQEWWLKQEGFPIGQFRGYQVIGFFKDQSEIDNSPEQQVGSVPVPGDLRYVDFNKDGVVNTFDRVPIGYTTMPRYTFGSSFGATIRNFDFNVHFQGAAKSSVFISSFLMYEFSNRGKVQDIHLGRWTPATHETATYPALHIGAVSQNHVQNTFFLKDNSYLRLKTAEIAYTLKPSAAEKIGIKGLRIYLSGVNLITWDKLKVLDPETASGSTDRVYPQSRNFSAGINLNF